MVCANIAIAQDMLGRVMLIENPSSYVCFDDAPMTEWEFLDAMCARTGCGLLLDVNNVFVSAKNHGTDPISYLAAFPMAHVKEIHLGGHDEQTDDDDAPLLIDAHGSPVADPVWALYESLIARSGQLATLIEWDNDVPAWPVLVSEARAANAILNRAAHARAA